MTPVDLAIEVYTELCPADVSQNAIQYWFQKNVGKLNNRIYTTFLAPETATDDFLQSSGEGMTEDEKSIYKGLYYLRYYQKQVDSYTGAAGIQTIIELDSDGGRVKMLDKNNLSKTFLTLRDSLLGTLEDEIQTYINGKCGPQQVAGDDTVPADYQIDTNSRD